MIKALIKIKNKPNVKIVKGIVRMIIRGLMNVFRKPSKAARISAEKRPSSTTPGKSLAVINAANDVIMSCARKFLII